jgi:serine/threonine protein kinase
VHRDVSPPNIMLSKNGEVKVVDFGLAKANSQVEDTDEGVVKGKFSYLAPETAYGEEVDLRADVFALGIILWEMLTGAPAVPRRHAARDGAARARRTHSFDHRDQSQRRARTRRDRSQGARAQPR